MNWTAGDVSSKSQQRVAVRGNKNNQLLIRRCNVGGGWDVINDKDHFVYVHEGIDVLSVCYLLNIWEALPI